MFENHMIQSRGFQNVSHIGQLTGFQVRIRTKYYRGIWASLIEGAEVTVDGQTFDRDEITWTIGDRTFTQDELGDATDVHWHFTEPATLTVRRPGGLEPGAHNVRVAVYFRASYMGSGVSSNAFSRQVVLVH